MRDSVQMRVTGIAKGAFQDCSTLKKLILSDGIKKLQSSAFKGCINLETVKIPESIQFDGNSQSAFEGCSKLSEVDMPKQASGTISGRMFQGCASLKSIKIPSGIRMLNTSVFHDCTELKSIVILGTPNINTLNPPCQPSMKIDFYIAGPENSVQNLPWGASKESTITWNWNPDNS